MANISVLRVQRDPEFSHLEEGGRGGDGRKPYIGFNSFDLRFIAATKRLNGTGFELSTCSVFSFFSRKYKVLPICPNTLYMPLIFTFYCVHLSSKCFVFAICGTSAEIHHVSTITFLVKLLIEKYVILRMDGSIKVKQLESLGLYSQSQRAKARELEHPKVYVSQ